MTEWDTTDLRVESLLTDGFREAHRLPRDERGSFAIRIVYLDGVERIDPSEEASLRSALERADGIRDGLHEAGHTRATVHVDVIDLNDGERRLDWDTLEDE